MHYIDLSVALEYLGGMKEIFYTVGKSFLETYKNFKEEVMAYKEKETEQSFDYKTSPLYNSFHSLKGITLNLGMVKLYDQLVILLQYLKDGIIEENEINKSLIVFEETYKELKNIIS